MSSVEPVKSTEPVTEVRPVNMKFEVVVIGVTDVNRSRDFYKNLGWRLDLDLDAGDFHGVQVTPPNSDASIIFGKGINAPQPGALSSLILAVEDIDTARNELVARGVDVSEVFHFAAGPLNDLGEKPRVEGRDPDGRSYFSFASFKDPDGNGWLLQEVTTRFPGREWKREPDVSTLASLLRETGEHHDQFEKAHAAHNWWDWYAAYLSARQGGSNADEATETANRYGEDVLHISRK